MAKTVDLWLDLRSPYSFLAKDPAYALETELDVTLRLRPFACVAWKTSWQLQHYARSASYAKRSHELKLTRQRP